MNRRTSRAMFRLLQADGNISVNKNLIHAIGLNEAILYCELLSRHSYFEDRNQLQEDGSFFNTIYDLQLGTGMGEKSQRTAIKNLEKLGLLKCKVKGVPARRFFTINFDCDIEEFILMGEENIIKIKEEIALKLEKSTVPPKGETSSAEGRNKKLQKAKLVQPKGSSNNTNFNNTNPNNTNLEEVEESSQEEVVNNNNDSTKEEIIELFSEVKPDKVTSYDKKALNELLNTYSLELIKKGIEVFGRFGGKSIEYLLTTLDNWKDEGITTPEAAELNIQVLKEDSKKANKNKKKKIKKIAESKVTASSGNKVYVDGVKQDSFNSYDQRDYTAEELEEIAKATRETEDVEEVKSTKEWLEKKRNKK